MLSAISVLVVLYCHVQSGCPVLPYPFYGMGNYTFLFANVSIGYMYHSTFQLEPMTSPWRVLMVSWLQGA